MINGGLVSITFRKLSPKAIVDLVVDSGLSCIEWGGDVHAPPGEIALAKEVRRMTTDAGLRVSSYGSYYCAGDDSPKDFGAVLESADALGAPYIRVWAGKRGSDTADQAYRQAVVEDTLRIADLAASSDIKISFEYHGNTLTDSRESVGELMRAAEHPGVLLHWQPPVYTCWEQRLESLRDVISRLSMIHVFQWLSSLDGIERRPLEDGHGEWLSYLSTADVKPGDTDVLLEFVRDDNPEQFLKDSETLRRWLAELHGSEPHT